jgi:hypothetical protein
LYKVVSNDLDKLNNWKTTLIDDRFLVRNFFEGYTQINFSFVKDIVSEKSYFISLPTLDKFICDVQLNYIGKNDTTFILKNDKKRLVKLNTPLLDSIFTNAIFKIDDSKKNDFFDKYKISSHLLREVLEKIYKYEFSGLPGRMQSQMNAGLITKTDYEDIINVFELNLRRNSIVEVCNIDRIGYVLVVYFFDKSISNNINVDLYFVPEKERSRLSKHYLSDYWKECSREFPEIKK